MRHSSKPRDAQAAPDTPFQESRHRQIAMRYAWHDSPRQRRRPKFCYLRLRELERLYGDRYGPTLPDDDAGRDELFIAAQHIAQGGDSESGHHIRAWALLWCPW